MTVRDFYLTTNHLFSSHIQFCLAREEADCWILLYVRARVNMTKSSSLHGLNNFHNWTHSQSSTLKVEDIVVNWILTEETKRFFFIFIRLYFAKHITIICDTTLTIITTLECFINFLFFNLSVIDAE